MAEVFADIVVELEFGTVPEMTKSETWELFCTVGYEIPIENDLSMSGQEEVATSSGGGGFANRVRFCTE